MSVLSGPCVAIDFETSGYAHSACAVVGQGRIEDGRYHCFTVCCGLRPRACCLRKSTA